MTRSIALDFEFAHPPAKVWRALTEPELLAKWLMSNDFQTSIGQKFNFKAKVEPTAWWDGIVHCEMLEAEPHKRLRYSWRGGPLDTVLTWTLSPTPSGGTHLRLEQTGFPADNERAFGGAKLGWEHNLGAPFNDVLKGIA